MGNSVVESTDRPLEKTREPVEIIARINKLTQENKISWHDVTSQHIQTTPGEGTEIQSAYEADYNGNKLRLTRKRTKFYVQVIKGNMPDLPLFPISFTRKRTLQRDKDTNEEFYWNKELLLEIIDANGTVIWSPKYVSILEGLEASVHYQITAPAYKNFVNEIFAED